MNEREHPADVPARGGLKSLLKKPGQTRSKSHKNRVVINEKLNEFFAADYIILIKEECCADYEEECDCCCQEPEMIRLGNCKECRADLTRHLSSNNSNNSVSCDARYGSHDSRNGDVLGLDCDPSSTPTIRRDYRQPAFGSEESQEEDDEDEDDEDDVDDDDDEDDGEEEEEEEEVVSESEESEETDKCEIEQNCNMPNCVTPSRVQQQQLQRPQQQQQETLSPPEGYKDVCDEETAAPSGDQQQGRLVCGECNYYHRQRNAATLPDAETGDGKLEIAQVTGKEVAKNDDNNDQQTSDQAQQTTPDLHQRYLVETITMTTVTERRIVREISEEETTRPVVAGSDEADTANANEPIENANKTAEIRGANEQVADRVRFKEPPAALTSAAEENDNKSEHEQLSTDEDNKSVNNQREGNDSSELSLSFKLGNVSLGMTNSLKPNSAVRQLFPDPRFISPPPAPAAKGVVAMSASLDPGENPESDATSEAQKFLITTESLRLFDAVKRSKMAAASRSDSSESESSSIKRTIERNALRRSLICKYETSSRKKNLRSKDLTLEERIRQLTCVDQEDQDNTGGSSASETSSVPTGGCSTTMPSVDAATVDDYEFPVRTSPSGEERPNKNDSRLCSSRISTGSTNIHQETTTTTTLVQQSSSSSSNSHHHHHHHHHHHQHQSTYKRITDLFAQKKMADANLPDLGLGDKAALAKEYSSKSSISKMNSDARKQFLASLAPLSCVASAGVDSREDYYQLSSSSSKQLNATSGSGSRVGGGSNRDSTGYNSDSSYSLEDIEAALRGEERNCKNAGGPPDVTRGTPTGNGPETGDATTDELLAFVEQDKSRTERIRRRYNETDQEPIYLSACHADEVNVAAANNGPLTNQMLHNEELEDDEDDELNDYGFNRRPSVRGIKPQFESSSEIVRQLRSRSAIPSAIAEKTRASFHGPPPSWPYYEITGETSTEKQQHGASTTFLLAGPALPLDQQLDQRSINPDGQHRENNTINRINTMQKQIDDIYQTIAETAVTVQGTLERGSYLESTLPRTIVRGAVVNDSTCHRYSHQDQLVHSQKNGLIHYHEQPQQQQQQAIPGGRMLRIAGGGDGAPIPNNAVYNTLPAKLPRPVNYPCGVSTSPQPQQTAAEPTKCYRTMYLVPYNAISDPTYQNIQRILPPHNSPNYANHIERYPYARNGRVLDQAALIQQQQNQLSPQQLQQQPRYYARPVPAIPGNGTLPNVHNQQAAAAGLHLHLHSQPEDYRFGGNAGSIQHHLPQQMASYNNVQNLPAYAVLAPSRPNGPPANSGYAYPLHHPASRSGGGGAADVQTQTMSLTPSSAAAPTTSCGSALLSTSYNNGTATHLGTLGSSSSSSSALSSPTKIQQLQQRNISCNVAERGVPEGAASAPSHDYAQTNSISSHTMSNSFLGHTSNVPPPNTQNSVYYAMNV